MKHDQNNLAEFAKRVLQIIEECDQRINAADNECGDWEEPCLDAYGQIVGAAKSRALIPESHY